MVHLAAVEYTLLNSIAIESREDIQSAVHWKDKLEPFEHQIQNLITFCRRAPVAMIADDVGLGKTISAGLILSELRVRKKVERALVLAPKILLDQWKGELKEKFAIEAEAGSGKNIKLIVKSRVPVVITTYDTFRDHGSEIPAGTFEMLILDEAHKLRNLYGGKKPPGLATAVAGALRNQFSKFVLMLTATPMQNRLWDLYSLIHCLALAKGHNNPFKDEVTFAMRYIADDHADARVLQEGRKEEFRRKLSDYIVRTSRSSTQLVFPEREVVTRSCVATSEERALESLVGRAMRGVGPLLRTNLAESLMSSPRALLSQVNTMVNHGTLPAEVLPGIKALVSKAGGGCKLPTLLVVLRDLQARNPEHWRAVVFTRRIETQRVICEALQAEGISCSTIGGGKSGGNSSSIKGFWQKPPRHHVLVSTDAGAEGINLQVCNVVVNYDLPWNPMVVEQRIGRVQRLASQHARVAVLNLVVANSVEELVVARLIARLQTIATCIGDVEGILEAASADEDSFEERLKELVVNSLMGQDTTEAQRRIQDSIERAKQIYEEERATVEKTMGTLHSMHSAGPAPPALEPTVPRMSVRDFVLTSLVLEGAKVIPQPDERFIVRRPGEPPYTATLNQEDPDLRESGVGAFGGGSTVLFAPGRPHFERLVGRWQKAAEHRVYDLRQSKELSEKSVAGMWVEGLGIGASLVGIYALRAKDYFTGTATFRAGVSVAHDRYETICPIMLETPGHGDLRASQLEAKGHPFGGEVDLGSEILESSEIVRTVLETNASIAEFCRFYDRRREEELSQAGTDSRLRNQVMQRFSPSLAATMVAAEGALYSASELEVSYSVGPECVYQSRLKVIGPTGMVLESPETARCEESGKVVPRECLARCEISGKSVLRHLLVKSSRSGRMAQRQYSGSCSVSGRVLLSDELGTSDVTGKVVDSHLLRVSPVSGKRGLDEEMPRCAFTGVQVLPAELKSSQVSGRDYRMDQEATSSVSGLRGHKSEFRTCCITGEYLLPKEGRESSLSGRFARGDKVVESAKTPGRFGLEGEMVRCVVTGRKLIRDEAVFSAVSGRPIDPEVAAHSARSSAPALPEELITCACSGLRLLPTETAFSDFSRLRVDASLLRESAMSGRKGTEEELATCAFSKTRVLKDEVEESGVSGSLLRRDRLTTSAVSGTKGDRSEFVTCAVSGATILPTESGVSSVSGRVVRADLLVASEKDPRRKGLQNETRVCSVSGKRLLADEVETSVVSGLLADRACMVQSQASKSWALPAEILTCPETRLLLLPSETAVCAVTGLRVDQRILGRSEASGRVGLAKLLMTCPESGKRAFEEEMVRCSVTGHLVLPEAVAACTLTSKPVVKRMLWPCAVTSRPVRKDLMFQSEKSGRCGHPDCEARCVWTGKRLLSDEAWSCSWTGVTFDKDLIGRDGAATPLRELLELRANLPEASGEHRTAVVGSLAPRKIQPKQVHAIGSPHAPILAAVIEWGGILGLGRKYGVFLCTFDPPHAIVGRVARLKEHGGTWTADGEA